MPPTKTYLVKGETYDIPDDKTASFLEKYPDAQEARSFVVDKDTFDIPIDKVDAFKVKYPNARDLNEKKNPSQDGGSISNTGATPSVNGSESSQIGAIAGLIKRPAQVDTPTPDNPNDPYKKAASLIDNNSVKGNVLPEVDDLTYQKTLQAANTILPSEVKTAALSPELSGRLQTTRQAINDPTNRKLAPDMAFEMGNTQRFADLLKARHTDDGYVDADGKPIANFNEGDIISVPKDKPLGDGKIHSTGYVQVINDDKGNQTSRDVSPSDPSFSDQQADASNNVTVYPNPSLSSKNKQQDYETANYNVINKYPALGGYIHIAKQQDAAIGIGKLLDSNPTVAAKMNDMVSKNPDLVSTEESRVATLNKATVQAYDLDKDAFAPDPTTMKMVDAPQFYQNLKALSANQTAAKALMDKAAPIKAALDKETDPARREQLTESYNSLVDQSKKIQDSDQGIKNFFAQPENKLVLDRLNKQREGQAIYSNLHKFFPKREAREADIEKVQAAPTTIPSALADGIKSLVGGAMGGVSSVINTIDNGVSSIIDSDAMHRDNIAANDKSELNNEANLAVKVHDSDIGNFVNGMLHTVGSLAPIMAGSMMTGGSPIAAAALNFSTGALSGYGDTKLEALRSGVPEKQASLYALANGVMTGVIYTGLGNLAKGVEGFKPSMGTIQGLMDAGTRDAAEKSLTSEISSYYLQKTGNTIAHAAQESLKMQVQQGINYLASNYINNTTGSNLKVDAPDVDNFLKTAASFSFLGGMHFSESLKTQDVRDKFIANAIGDNAATSLGIINTLKNNPDIKISDLNRLNDVESAIVDNLALHIPAGVSTGDKAKIVALNEQVKTATQNAESTSGTIKEAYEKQASGLQKEINEIIAPKEKESEPKAQESAAEGIKPTLVAVQSPKEVADSQKETTTIAPQENIPDEKPKISIILPKTEDLKPAEVEHEFSRHPIEIQNLADEHFETVKDLEDAFHERIKSTTAEPASTEGTVDATEKIGDKPVDGATSEAEKPAGESGSVSIEGPSSSKGAAAGEADEPAPTSVKNATVYKEREERGDDPIVKAIGRSYEGTVMPEAREKIANGTDPKELAKAILQRKADGFKSDTESAILLIGRNQLHLEKDSILKDMESAQENGDKDAYNEASNRLVANEDAMRDNDNAAEHLGGESARGLAARRMMINRDLSLTAIERKVRAHTADGELPSDFKAKFDKLVADHEEINKKYDEAIKRAEAAEAQTSVDNIDADNKQAKKASKTKKVSVADRALSKLDEWEKKIKSAGYADVTGVVSLIQTGITAAKLAIKAGKSIHEALKTARAKIEDHFGKDWDKTEWENVEKDVFGIGEHEFEMKDGKLVVPKKLLHELVENGFKDHAALTDKVHEMAKEQFPELTKREVRDAITGYGKTLNMNKGEIERQLREIKNLGRLQSGLEDVTEKGQSPLRSGLQRDKPTDAVRNATKKVKDAMKKLGIEVKVDNRTQDEKWASALDAVKTRLTNRITDLKGQIDRKEKDVRKKGVEYDDKAKELKAEADSLQKVLDDIVRKPEMTDEERTALAEKAMQRSIAEVDERIQKALKGDYTEKERKKVMQSDKMKALEAERAEKKEFLKSITPKEVLQQREDEAYLKAAKSAQESYGKRLQERLNNQQFDPIAKKIRPEDRELNNMRNANKLKKRQLEQAIANYKKDNRSAVQKRFDAINQFRRAMLLSNPLTIGKLASAAAQRIIYNPIEDVVGAGVSKVLPRISEKAPIEGGGFNKSAHWAGLKELVSLATRQDAAHMWETGHSILSEMNEKGAPRAELKSWEKTLEFFGMIHQQMKNPVKRMAYKTAYEKAIDNAAAQGKDINADGVMEGIQSRAYQYANRQIFMQDNLVSDFYKQGITWLERQKKDGKPAPAATNMAAIMRFLLPIVKVPTNFVNEKSSYAIGIPKALYQMGTLFNREGTSTLVNRHTGNEIKTGTIWSRAMENITEDQADYVIRQLKKGIIGNAVIALGYMNPQNAGGYYSGNRKKGDLEAGDLQFFGINVPHLLQHAPLLEMLQIGATIRRAHDKAAGKIDDSAFAGWDNGIKSVVHQNIEDVPYWKTPSDLVEALGERKSFMNTMGRLTKGFIIPPIVQQTAQLFDHTDKSVFDPVKRKEDGFWDAIGSGIPAWRNTLEEKNVKQNAKVALAEKLKDGAKWDDLPDELKTKAGFKAKTIDIGTSEKDFIRDSKMDPADVAFRNMKTDKQKIAFDHMTDDEKKAHIKLLHPDNIGEAITKYIPEKDRESFVMGLSQQQESAYKSNFVNGMPVGKVWDAYQNGDLSKSEFDKYLYDQHQSKKVADDAYEKYKESESPETEFINRLGKMPKADLSKELDRIHGLVEDARTKGTLTKKDYKLYQDAVNLYGDKKQ